VEEARRVTVPTLTMMGAKDELLRRECISQLHRNLAGPKSWAAIEDGPHLLPHWKSGDRILRAASG